MPLNFLFSISKLTMSWFICLTVVLLLLKYASTNTIVETNVGQIKGISATDGNYTLFTGIPFAEVDKSNPFGLSTRYPRFEQPFEAYYESAICPQREEFNNTLTGTIDCLQLNVYVPDSASPSNPVPVIVWIYGGGYSIGFANRYLYGPSFIVRHDVILVTINYRLGPYGFMCLDTPQVPGNQGLKDQLLGLRWIKENIEFFGGDPNQITAFGQSVGSMSIHLHMLSPQEELFQKAIMHSGAGFSSNLITDSDRTAPIQLADRLGFVTDNMDEALAFLVTQDADSVIGASSQISSSFWPCIESDHEGIEKLVTDYTINLDVQKIRGQSVLLGYTSDEWIGTYSSLPPQSFPFLSGTFYNYIQNAFTFDDNRLTNIEKIVRSFYLGRHEFSQEVMHDIANFASDTIFVHPMHRSIPSFLENGADKLFLFKFSYLGERNFVRRLNNISVGGAAHTDELGYLFDMQFIPEQPNPQDQLIIDKMTQMWTNFAKYGDPTPEITSTLPVKWEPIVSGDLAHNYMDINLEMRADVNPFHERMAFWDLFYEAFSEYERGYRTNHSPVMICNVYLGVMTVFLLKFFNIR